MTSFIVVPQWMYAQVNREKEILYLTRHLCHNQAGWFRRVAVVKVTSSEGFALLGHPGWTLLALVPY